MVAVGTHNHVLLNLSLFVSSESGSNYDSVDVVVYVLHFSPFSAKECETKQVGILIIFKICIWEVILGPK
jgi:hypothetical protein